MIAVIEPQTSTYNASDPAEERSYYGLIAGYENALRAQNRTSPLLFSVTSHSSIQALGTVISGVYTFALQNALDEFLASTNRAKRITLAEAHAIAMKAMNDADSRRKKERELEAKFWEKLDGLE